jgi:hypothetical protein
MVELQHLRYLRLLRFLRNRPRIKVYRKRLDPMTFYNDKAFFDRYRFTKEFVLWLTNQLRRQLEPIDTRGKSLTALEKVLIALRFYATGCFHIVSGDLLRVSASSACRCIRQVSFAIARLRKRYISMPDNREIPQIANEFKQLSR